MDGEGALACSSSVAMRAAASRVCVYLSISCETLGSVEVPFLFVQWLAGAVRLCFF